MTDKELHKLGRRELLQLMLAQGREAEKAKQELAEAQESLHKLEESYERLKRRLDDKDMQIHKLRAALQSAQAGAGTVSAAVPATDDYYAPPPAQQVPPPAQAAVRQPAPSQPVQPIVPPPAPSQPVQSVQPVFHQPAPQHTRPVENSYNVPARPDPAAPRHFRREQEYYDYLFGPVSNQSQPVPQQQKERQRPQPQQAPPVRNTQQAAAEPRPQPSQWAVPQYVPQHGYYSPPPQHRPPVYVYDREPQPTVIQQPPEPHYPEQGTDEFIPIPDRAPESMQMLNAVEIVNGVPVSQNQILRPQR